MTYIMFDKEVSEKSIDLDLTAQNRLDKTISYKLYEVDGVKLLSVECTINELNARISDEFEELSKEEFDLCFG